jgi:hypothetical protein
MWRTLIRTGDTEPTLNTLRRIFDADEATLDRDLRALTDTLFDRGLLERRGDASA